MSNKTNPSNDKELDVTNTGRGIWLVKVPKYIANKWEKAPSNIEVAKLKLVRNQGPKVQVSMTLSESVLCMDSEEGNQEAIPKNYKLDITNVTSQSMAIFSQTIYDGNSDREKLALDGRILHRLECRPIVNEEYMKMKTETFKIAHKPVRSVQQLDKVVLNYKPVATHKFLKEYADKKKAEGKRSRDDKNAVTEMLFKAFEKHQYYNIRDLVLITKQPVGYLKEILKEVCNHNLKNPHKNMWELKPEYRHYKSEQPQPSESQE